MGSRKVRSICFECHSRCGVILEADNGRLIRVTGTPAPKAGRPSRSSTTRKRLDVHRLVNRTVGLDTVQDAFEHLSSAACADVKVMIRVA